MNDATILGMKTRQLGTPLYSRKTRGTSGTNMGFIFEIAAIAGAVGALGTAGVSAYGTIEQLGLAEDIADVQMDIMQKRATMENDLLAAQGRLVDMQTTYYGAQQETALTMQQAEAEYYEAKLARMEEMEAGEFEIAQIEQEQRKAVAEAAVAAGVPVSAVVPIGGAAVTTVSEPSPEPAPVTDEDDAKKWVVPAVLAVAVLGGLFLLGGE